MNKNTINQICDKLIMLADNYAEQERILRSLEALVRSLKDEAKDTKQPLNQPDDKLGNIEKLLKELMEQKEGKGTSYPKQWPYDTHPYLNPKVGDQPGWWNQGPWCGGGETIQLPSNTPRVYGSSITVVPCSNPSDQQIVYADTKGVHIKDAQNEQ